MPSTINLRRKIKSVTNTKQITKAMQMVAASKMRRAQEAVLATRAYADSGYEILARLQSYLLKLGQDLNQPLLKSRQVQTITLVIISSDRGLAGGYNANILKQTLQFLQANTDKTVKIITVGRKIHENLNRLNIAVEASFTDFPGRPTSQDILPLAKLTIDTFLQAEADQVTIIYTRFYSTLKQIAEQKQLLPVLLEDPASEATATDYVFEPTSTKVLGYIVPRMVELQLFQTILDAIASEHSARMLAMKNATDNATQLIDDLRLTYNSVRQASITNEIAEISAGANAQGG